MQCWWNLYVLDKIISPHLQNEVKKSQFNLWKDFILERPKSPLKPLGLHKETSPNHTSLISTVPSSSKGLSFFFFSEKQFFLLTSSSLSCLSSTPHPLLPLPMLLTIMIFTLQYCNSSSCSCPRFLLLEAVKTKRQIICLKTCIFS